MTIRNSLSRLMLLAYVSAMAVSCTPVIAERGNMLQDYQMKEVVPGVHTQSDVLRILGSPTAQAPFDPSTWYYIGQETEKKGILDPKVVKERIVVVSFDPDGTVQKIEESRPGHIDVPIAKQTTPTNGSELTFAQQLLGNLGKFNKDEKKGHAGAN